MQRSSSITIRELAFMHKTLAGGVHALTSGSGPAIVCIAGWPQTAEAFLDVMDALSRNHRLLVLDPPGLGNSAPSTTGYDTQAISRLLMTAVESELGETTPYHLVGHDVGAWIAFSWAALQRSTVLSVTLMDATFFGFTPAMSFPPPYDANIKMWQFTFNRLPELPELLTAGRERVLLDWLFDNKAVHPERITKARRDIYVAAYSRPGAMSQGFAYYRAVLDSAQKNVQLYADEKLRIPVMALGGDHAAGEIMKSLPEQISTLTDLCRSVSLPDCGHYLMEEQPEACATTILDFIHAAEQSNQGT